MSKVPLVDGRAADAPLTEQLYDIAVVGAGIVGLAVAREILLRRPNLRVVIFDREASVAAHQTGHNSGVIHSGIYYTPGSLKARLCVEGSRLMYAYCVEHGIAYERCGKLIVATSESELPQLDALEARGRANGVPGLRRVSAEEIVQIEPECRGVSALYSPNTGIVDYRAVARSLEAELRSLGAEFKLGCRVSALHRHGRTTVLAHDDGHTGARWAIACAGLWSDRLAEDAGAPADPRIIPFRGAYLRLQRDQPSVVRGLVYPVPDPALPFLGVHITKQINGDVLLGPTAMVVGAKDAYKIRTMRLRDLASTFLWPGTWRVGGRFWKTALNEIHMAVSRKDFVRACSVYVPALRRMKLESVGQAGVRAQAVARDGTLVDDFVISETPGATHLRNAPSPAATSSLALAREVVDRLEKNLT